MGSPSISTSQQNGLSFQASQQLTDLTSNSVQAGLSASKQANADIKDAYNNCLSALDKKDQTMLAERQANDRKFNSFVENTMAGFTRLTAQMGEMTASMTRMMSSQTESMFRFQGQSLARM